MTQPQTWSNLPDANSVATVRVSELGSDQVQIDFDPQLTVGDYLNRAEISSVKGKTITLNGQPAKLEDRVEPNSVLVVTERITNGR